MGGDSNEKEVADKSKDVKKSEKEALAKSIEKEDDGASEMDSNLYVFENNLLLPSTKWISFADSLRELLIFKNDSFSNFFFKVSPKTHCAATRRFFQKAGSRSSNYVKHCDEQSGKK